MSPFRRRALLGAGLAAALTVGTVLVGWGADSPAAGARLTVADPYIPAPATPGGMAAGYLTVRNSGAGGDELVGVRSPGATSVTMHRSTDRTMEDVTSFPVPANGELRLARGGNHLMIMGWTKAPVVGDRLELELTFAKGGTIAVQVPVESLTYRPGSQ
jgi:periplasmic copper chaperone A